MFSTVLVRHEQASATRWSVEEPFRWTKEHVHPMRQQNRRESPPPPRRWVALVAAGRAVKVVVVGRDPVHLAAAERVLDQWALTPAGGRDDGP